MSVSPQPASSTRRPRLRFTLRLLLALLTVLCIALGYWTHRAREQQRIVKMLTQSEGTRLYYDYQYRYNEFHMPGRRSGLPRFLIDYLGTDFFHCVASIWVENRELVAELSKLHGVQDIEVNDPSLSDSDLVPITRMRGLKILTVNWPWHPQWPTSYSRITDESLTRISRMQDIEDVYIGSYCFSRRGIDALAKAPALENAHLWGCDLADEKMPYEISRGSDVLVVENNVGQLGRVLGTKIHVK